MMDTQFNLPMLVGDNYADWKEKALLALGCMDLDLAIREDEPPALTNTSTPNEKAHYERWERSNRLSLMLIKANVSKSIRGSIPDNGKIKDYLKSIEDQFMSSEKAQAIILMGKLCSMRYSGSKCVREHIMGMRDIAAQLKAMNIDIFYPFLVHFVIHSLPKEFGPFKVSYNTQKEVSGRNALWWYERDPRDGGFCAEHNIIADIEVVPMDYVNTAMDRLALGDVKYRFIINVAGTLTAA